MIRELAASPPTTVEKGPQIIYGGTSRESMEQERQVWHGGIWRWHRYFNNPNRAPA